MVLIPENVQKVVEDATARYASDIDRATREAMKRIKKLPEYPQLVEMFLEKAVQEMVYDARHIVNVRTKRQAGVYGGKGKVRVGDSSAVRRVTDSMYNYHIAGTVLGLVIGKDLPTIAESELRIGNGHLHNSRLCYYLSRIVPKDKRVKDAVTEKKLRELFRRAQRDVDSDAA